MFAIETYFVYWMRLMAYSELQSCVRSGYLSDLRSRIENLGGPGFRNFVSDILSKEPFLDLGILNYEGGSLFDWFASDLSNSETEQFKDHTINLLWAYPNAQSLGSEDTLRRMYQEFVPKQVRHGLGSYYTPEWLTTYLLKELDYVNGGGNPWDKRILDPTCGSGTFLVAALSQLLCATKTLAADPTHVLERILINVVGYDINPLAVMAAKTNYIFHVCQFIRSGASLPQSMQLPVYLCDSIYSGKPHQHADLPLFANSQSTGCRIANETFYLPTQLFARERWSQFVAVFIDYVVKADQRTSCQWQTLIHQCGLADVDNTATAELERLFLRACAYQSKGLLPFFQSMLEDAPAPYFNGTFDIVIGNPPWVNWEYLPPDYRGEIQHLWIELGLFDLKGKNFAFSKEDISSLVLYVACDRYLVAGGRLGFLVPQSLFKSSLNGRGFRQFRLRQHGDALKVLAVDDLSALLPFAGVNNRTAIVFLERGAQTQYPVPYNRWKLNNGRKTVPESWLWEDVVSHLDIEPQCATPTDPADPTSYWATVSSNYTDLLTRLTGVSPYVARTGMFTGGANGVFYLQLLKVLPDGNLLVRNVTERVKRLVPSVEAVLEPHYVYPLLRGRDVRNWSGAPSAMVLLPHSPTTKIRPVSPDELRETAPLTYAYLKQFEDILLERKGFAGWERWVLEEGFYACQRIGDYTFKPYKTVWRFISKDFCSCVLHPNFVGANNERPIVPHEKLMLLGFDNSEEAYFVCALLSCAPIRYLVEARMVETQIAPHVIRQLPLPTFDGSNEIHNELSRLCREGHIAVERARDGMAEVYLRAIDELSPCVLPVSEQEVTMLRKALIERHATFR